MKKKKTGCALAAVICTVLMGCSAGAQETDEQILARIAEVNTVPALLEQHKSVEYRSVLYDADGEEYDAQYMYADQDAVAYEYVGAGVDYCGGGEGFGYLEELGLPYRTLFVDDAYETQFAAMHDIALVEFAEEEQLLSVREEDGLLTVESVLPNAFAKEYYPDYKIVQQMAETDEYHTLYKIDPDSCELQSVLGYILHEDGSDLVVEGTKVYFDVDAYQPRESLLDSLYSEDSREVTVIADPGTEEETVYTQTICKGGLIRMEYSQEHQTLYSDEACTQPVRESLAADALQSDAVYYMMEGK